MKTSGAVLLGSMFDAPWLAARESQTGYLIGCYTRPWDQHDYRVALDQIAAAGYRYAGIMTAKGRSWVIITPQTAPEEAARVGEEVRKRGLKTISVYGDFSVRESLEQGIRELRALVRNCVACGSPHLLLGGVGEEALVERYYKAIAECCHEARASGVRLSIKPHGGQNATGAQCRKLVERVNHPHFGVWYDPGNIFYYSEGRLDPVEDCASVDGLVMGMSVKDFRPPKDVMVTPGTGRVDFPKVLARLRSGGFKRGPLVVECVQRGTIEQTTAEAKQARLFLEQLVAQVR
ncbi:MAG: sugar phosphate isomerase/epimerase family protein [Verrucomicrobiales bacterium]|nr:sugar phosphate isomerase/epimerase family protein [Verrucomicrobiales bacterium]